MLPGFRGSLVSEFFLESRLAEEASSEARLADLRRQFVAWRRRCESLGPASSLRTLLESGAEPLLRLLGFAAVDDIHQLQDSIAATVHGAAQPLALFVAVWGARLDPLWRTVVVESRQREADWCLVFNGTHARLIEAGRVYSRRYAEFDLDVAADEERTFAALWMLLQAGTLSSTAAGHESKLHALVNASEQHGLEVCRSLRTGVLEASGEVLRALIAGPATLRFRSAAVRERRGTPARHYSALENSFEQALTIVYRILFLLFAEARSLVPLWHPVYRESYSIDSLRIAAERVGASPGLWDTLRAVSHLAHAGCRAGDLRVTAFNGRLFAPGRTPLAERRDLDDEAARRAVVALSTRPAPHREGRERIAYRDLGVEQLGAIYETLLDYRPRVIEAPDLPPSRSRASASLAEARPGSVASGGGKVGPASTAHRRAAARTAPQRDRRNCRFAVSLERGSGLRKATGTFYTPQRIAEYLVRRALAPLVTDADPARILGLRILDPAMGSGAFLVAACGYLAQAYEAALIRSGACHASDIGPPEQAVIRRTVAERCLYGVDLNPMAVQLARLSLWLATLAADRPLSFLDHHLQVGDSLVGAWLACLRRPPVRRPRRTHDGGLPLFEHGAVGDALRQAVPVRFRLATTPNDTVQQVREKERTLAALNRRDTALSKWKRIADLWCSQWFTDAAPPPSAFGTLSDAILTGVTELPATTATQSLEYADTIATSGRFFHWELEFPEAFFDAQGARLESPGFDALIGNPPWDMVRADAGPAEERSVARSGVGSMLHFTRDAGVYSYQSDGHANRYQLFLERAIALTRQGGRLGLVLPSGLASDHGSAALRRLLFSRCSVDALVGFDNRRGVFPIHRSVRFLLVTATNGATTAEIRCRLGEQNAAVLDNEAGDSGAAEEWFRVRVTPSLLQRLSGDDLAIPDLRNPTDLAILERATALFPPLGDERGWAARFGRELNATDDRRHFQGAGRGWPVVEGKHVEPFRVALERARYSVNARDAGRLLGTRPLRARLAYRDVASATNRQTLIAAVLPPGCVSVHTVFCLRTALRHAAQHFLCGLFNSFVVNYLVRLRVTTHVTTAIVERLPIPRQDHSPAAFRRIAALARCLARRSEGRAYASLNAYVAALYRLSRDEFAYVLDTFPLVPREERDAAMREFDSRIEN